MNLVWLRNDLRSEDNPALYQACKSGPTLCVCAITPQQWQVHDEAPAKIGFYLDGLTALAENLQDLNIGLKIIRVEQYAKLADAFSRFCQTHEVTALWYNCEYPVNEQRRDQQVSDAVNALGVQVHAIDRELIQAPGQLLTGGGTPYHVFTPFYRKWLSLLGNADIEPLPAPDRQPEEPPEADRDQVPDRLQGWDLSYREDLWPAGESQAKIKLQRFMHKHHEDYAQQRDFPARPGTSTLSPYLACGMLSVRQCIAALRQSPDPDWMHSKWLAELVWREFYRHLMAAYPRLSMGGNFKAGKDTLRWQQHESHWQAWAEGKTGFPLVDAAMRQLLQTGWMHNRLRMLVAVFLSKLLLIDWRRGEQFFMQHLIDGDFASNNGGWQWAASTGADAAPYFRIFSPLRQSQKFDPKGEFIRRFVPELATLNDKDIHQPSAQQREQLNYPEPIIDYAAARRLALDTYSGAFQKSD